jgi:subtilisin
MATKTKGDPNALRSMIVTFKPKDKRRDKTSDKVDIVRSAMASSVDFVDASSVSMSRMGPMTGVGMGMDRLGFDINLYDAPIVTLAMNQAEIDKLSNDPNVESVEEDGFCYALPSTLVFEGQPSPMAETVPVGVSQVKAPSAWGCSRGKGIKVAILDTGIDPAHPDLAANVKGAVSFVPGETFHDGNGHGTHCAGTVAAAENGAGVVGVAPEASLYAVKTLANNGSGQWSWLIAGINWAIQNKVHIISMSLGGTAPSAVEAACNAAFNAGILLIAASGNNNGAIGAPGKYKNVIAVGAIDNANVRAPFSNFGPELEICAPGVNVLSTKPGGGYQNMSGTSMACPHVAGGAAVVWGSHRFATNLQIWNLLGSTADNLGPPGWDPHYGYGRLDVDQAAMAMSPAPAVPLKP